MDIRDIPPPRGGEAIYDFLARHLSEEQRLADLSLPDERSRSTDHARWVPGARDRLLSDHTLVTRRPGESGRILHLLVRAARRQSGRSLRRLHKALARGFPPGYLDDLLELVVEGFVLGSLEPQEVRKVGLWLTARGTHRMPVKMGLALLGVTSVDDAREMLLTLGRHDEFSLHVCAALANGDSEPEASLWQLAREADGWARIHAVEQLSSSKNPAIKAWLLREGFRNSVADEYLAHTAAVTGGLAAALGRQDVDGPLLRGGRDIVRALLADYRPTFTIDDYDPAAVTVSNLLRHLRDRSGELEDFLAVDAIRAYLQDPEADWDERSSRGWTVARRVWMEAVCRQILARPAWRNLVAEGLQSDDETVFHAADQVARKLGMETFDAHLRHLHDRPFDQTSWLRAMQECPPQRIDEIVALAEEKLPLEDIATGPAESTGDGSGYVAHRCLGVVVQELGRFSGKGWRLIATAMRSPVVWNRNMALRALGDWERRDWPPEARRLLAAAKRKEPTEWTAKELGRLLREASPRGMRRWTLRPEGAATAGRLSADRTA
ncbi:MAG: hypothetical protein M3133_08195 [Actinomycetota bacterium]|nr:hypothetical protein [Actinomycetota bacterium]